GTNDVPVITGGATTGAVKEDDANQNQATGQLTVVDPDHGAHESWSVVGGTESGGELHIDSNNAVSVVDVGNPDPLIGNVAIVRTNIDPSSPTTGLKL